MIYNTSIRGNLPSIQIYGGLEFDTDINEDTTVLEKSNMK